MELSTDENLLNLSLRFLLSHVPTMIFLLMCGMYLHMLIWSSFFLGGLPCIRLGQLFLPPKPVASPGIIGLKLPWSKCNTIRWFSNALFTYQNSLLWKNECVWRGEKYIPTQISSKFLVSNILTPGGDPPEELSRPAISPSKSELEHRIQV